MHKFFYSRIILVIGHAINKYSFLVESKLFLIIEGRYILL